ncbi:hypothetical protein AMK06_CH00813 [Rhizobium sp. N541]|nr:hypothetical protein AMK06_CH00813 [Rhizobium sp. N541]ANM22140.1 hypothetical protein AMK07_CH00813 [Rhizobium sp. N941]
MPRKGRNVVRRSSAMHAPMLIGRIPSSRVQELAESVRSKLSAQLSSSVAAQDVMICICCGDRILALEPRPSSCHEVVPV